jgi:hypothetical protein
MLTEQMIQEASEELQQNSYQKIQYDTATKWAARAVAAYRFSVEVTTADVALSAYEAGNEYAAEAVEHIAAVEDGSLLEELSNLLAAEKMLAFQDLIPSSEHVNFDLEKEQENELDKDAREESKNLEEDKNEAQS